MHLKTHYRLWEKRNSRNRKLEIGPGDTRIAGFETLNIVPGPTTDYVADAMKPLPFKDNTFEVVYASHILEHVPWYLTHQSLAEWVRILKPGGHLEVWVPDGLKIAKAFVDAEEGNNYIESDGWYRFNPTKDPTVWASGRIFTYGNGTTDTGHPNWHRALFSARWLKQLFQEAGLVNIRQMTNDEVRGYDHGWINLGMTGKKAVSPA